MSVNADVRMVWKVLRPMVCSCRVVPPRNVTMKSMNPSSRAPRLVAAFAGRQLLLSLQQAARCRQWPRRRMAAA